MNTPVIRAKYSALHETCNPSRNLTKHRKRPTIPTHQICKMLKKGQWPSLAFFYQITNYK